MIFVDDAGLRITMLFTQWVRYIAGLIFQFLAQRQYLAQ